MSVATLEPGKAPVRANPERMLISHYAQMLGMVLLGLLLARTFGLDGLRDAEWFRSAALGCLAVTMFVAVTGIKFEDLIRYRYIVLLALTVGIAAKWGIMAGVSAVFIGAFIAHVSIGFVQIDPLASKAMESSSRMTPAGNTVMAQVSTLDDVVTQFVMVTSTVVMAFLGVIDPRLPDSLVGWTAGVAFLMSIALASVSIVWLFVNLKRQKSGVQSDGEGMEEGEVELPEMGRTMHVGLGVASGALTMIAPTSGAVATGLTFRPERLDDPAWPNPPAWVPARAANWLEKTTLAEAIIKVILNVVLLMLGALMAGIPLDWAEGLPFGALAFLVQIPVGAGVIYLAKRRLKGSAMGAFSRLDGWLFCLGQQLGITAIVLGLNAELWQLFPQGTLHIVVPAIVGCNMLHFAFNVGFNRALRVPRVARYFGLSTL